MPTRRIALEALKEPKTAEVACLVARLLAACTPVLLPPCLPALLHTRRIALELLKEPKTAEALQSTLLFGTTVCSL